MNGSLGSEPLHALSGTRGNVYQKLKLCLYFCELYKKVHKFLVVANHNFFITYRMMVNEGPLNSAPPLFLLLFGNCLAYLILEITPYTATLQTLVYYAE